MKLLKSLVSKRNTIQAFIFAMLSVAFLFILHHLPVNQLFIDPFSEAIKNHDIMDVSFSKFRNHTDTKLFDDRIMILNSEVTNRKDIATTIDYLSRHGVAGIGVDLIFESDTYDDIDSSLAAVLDDDLVVLGYTFESSEDHLHTSVLAEESDKFFKPESDHNGYVNLATNDGFSVRAFEPFHTIDGEERASFAVKLASKLDPDVVKCTQDRHHDIEWINFRRLQPGKINATYPINSNNATHYAFTGVSDFLADTASYDQSYLKDKLVLIGFNGEHDKAFSMKDRYFTPLNEIYHGRSLPDMHGVVVHANIISMLLDKDFIEEIPESVLYLGAFLIFFINYFFFQYLEGKELFMILPLVRVLQIFQFIFLFSMCIIMITFFNIKIGFILIITAVILSFELFEFYEHKLEKKVASIFKRRIKKNH